MTEEDLKVGLGEAEALEALRESTDPMVRVIYGMAMRQLAVVEQQIALSAQQSNLVARSTRIEDEVIHQGGILRRMIDFLDRKYSNGSASLKSVLLGEK